MKRVNVLYLSYDGMTDPLGQSQVLPYLIGLSNHNYAIHLVSFEKPDKFIKHKKYIHAMCDEAGINWHPQDYALGGSLFDTVRQVRRMRTIAFYLNSKHHFKIVHCRSYIAALAGLRLKRSKNTRFIFDMRGFWADERVDGKLWNLKNPIYKTIYTYFKRKEIEFIKESDCTISLTKNGADEILSWKKLKKFNPIIKVIPCCVDLQLFNPEGIEDHAKEILKQKLGIKKDMFVLGYVGSIGTWYMLSEMLDYFNELKIINKNAKFLFVSGEKPNYITKLAAEKNISSDDIIVTSALHSEVPLHISLFDKSIFFIRPTYSKKASSPTKQGEIMAMGIPLICNSGVGDTSEIVLKYNAGKIVENFSAHDYKQSLSSKNEFDELRTRFGAKEYFSLEKGVNDYLRVYKEING